MDYSIYNLVDAKFILKIDCNCGYLKIQIEKSDRDKTTFVRH